MNKGVIVILAIALVMTAGCSSNEWVDNQSMTMSVRACVNDEALVDLQIRRTDGSGKTVVDVVQTRASVYHRYKVDWITNDCILLDSSDIGLRVIVIDDAATLYYAKSLWDSEGKIVLYDDMYQIQGYLTSNGVHRVIL